MREARFSSRARAVAELNELRGVAILAVMASHAGLVFGPEIEAARALTVPALGVGATSSS